MKNRRKEKLLAKIKNLSEIGALKSRRPIYNGLCLTNDGEGSSFISYYNDIMQVRLDPMTSFCKKYDGELWYVYVSAIIFEYLPEKEAEDFPYNSVKFLTEEIDWNAVKSKFCQGLLLRPLEWIKDDEMIALINKSASFFLVPLWDGYSIIEEVKEIKKIRATEPTDSIRYNCRLLVNTVLGFLSFEYKKYEDSEEEKLSEEEYVFRSFMLFNYTPYFLGRMAAISENETDPEKYINAEWVWVRDFLFECLNAKSV
jgi:hypothetical protein